MDKENIMYFIYVVHIYSIHMSTTQEDTLCTISLICGQAQLRVVESTVWIVSSCKVWCRDNSKANCRMTVGEAHKNKEFLLNNGIL